MYGEQERSSAQSDHIVIDCPLHAIKREILRNLVRLHLDPAHLGGRLVDPYAAAVSRLERLPANLDEPVRIGQRYFEVVDNGRGRTNAGRLHKLEIRLASG